MTSGGFAITITQAYDDESFLPLRVLRSATVEEVFSGSGFDASCVTSKTCSTVHLVGKKLLQPLTVQCLNLELILALYSLLLCLLTTIHSLS